MNDAAAQVAAAIETYGVPRWVAVVPISVRQQLPAEIKRQLLESAPVSEGWTRQGDKLVLGRGDRTDTLTAWAQANVFAVLTVKEIAAAAGVSRKTVRRYIADRPDIFRKSDGRTYEVRDPNADRQADKR
jgi:hypothetical protein